MVTSGLKLEFIQSAMVPVSKPGLETSWGQVGCAVVVAEADMVIVVVAVNTEVIVWVDGRMVGQVLDPDLVCVMVEVTVKAGTV